MFKQKNKNKWGRFIPRTSDSKLVGKQRKCVADTVLAFVGDPIPLLSNDSVADRVVSTVRAAKF